MLGTGFRVKGVDEDLGMRKQGVWEVAVCGSGLEVAHTKSLLLRLQVSLLRRIYHTIPDYTLL